MVRNDVPGSPPDTVYVYMYNITNLDDVRDGEKPHLQEVGPYVFSKMRAKQEVRFDREGDVYFQEYVYFLPHPDFCLHRTAESAVRGSGDRGPDSDLPPSEQTPQCFETDTIVTLNLPLIGVLKVVDVNARGFRHLVDMAIQRFFYANRTSRKFKGLFMRRTVQEMLFGYEDELLTDLASIVPSLYSKARFQLMPNMTSAGDALALRRTAMTTHPAGSRQIDAPSGSGKLRRRDGSASAGTRAWCPVLPRAFTDALKRVVSKVREFFRGLERWATADAAGWRYLEWQGLTEVTCWGEGHVESVLGGTDALQFSPGLTTNDSVHIFVPELFRMAKLNVTGTVERQGVTMLKYQPDIAVADPDPRFFTEISGLMNISACTAVGPSGHASESSGPDILMSFPHFCYVDPAVAQHTTGVSPCNHSRHDLWLGVEPTTGITMAARKRLQVSSTFDGRYSAFDPHLRSTVLPLFWAEEAGDLDATSAAPIKGSLYPALGAIGLLSDWKLYVSLICIIITLLFMPLLATPQHPRSHLHSTTHGRRDDVNGGVHTEPAVHGVVTGVTAHALPSGAPSHSPNTDRFPTLESMQPVATSAGHSGNTSEPHTPTANVRVEMPLGDSAGGGGAVSTEIRAEVLVEDEGTDADDASELLQAHRQSVSSVIGSMFAGWGGGMGGSPGASPDRDLPESPHLSGAVPDTQPPAVDSHAVSSFRFSDGSAASTEMK